ncbi:MAG: hypothetical protein HOV81_36720 [Kofleriaceae bacterium]|nr:hypothetical protein [Kofleriaceae bacterium]
MKFYTHAALLTAALLGCGDNNKGQEADGGASSFRIGGTVAGLDVDGLTIANNGDTLAVASGATSFEFDTKVASGATYAVTITTQPTGKVCTVDHGTGTATADVSDVYVACIPENQHSKQWTWRAGHDVVTNSGMLGVYGTLGVPAATNYPGGREWSRTWTDKAGNLWLFGGYGFGSAYTTDSSGANNDFGGQLNDLWKFDPASGHWTWVSGANGYTKTTGLGASGASAVYGTLGTPAAANVPGGREEANHWVDASGAVWIFGGVGIDANGVTGAMNDLWKFADGQWTWMGGTNSVGSVNFGGSNSVYGTKGIADAANLPGGRYGAASWTDAQGNFWLFGGSGVDSQPFGVHGNELVYLNDLWKYTPGQNGAAGTWTWVAGADTAPPSQAPRGGYGVPGVYGTLGTAASTNYPGSRNAAATWLDAAGNVWMFGGLGFDVTGARASFLNDLWKYTPSTGQWTWMGGPNTLDSPGNYGTLGQPNTANVPTARYGAATWVDGDGKFWLLGGQGMTMDTNFCYQLNDLWKLDPATGEWTWMGGTGSCGTGNGLPGVYGTLGTAAATNSPGGRYGILSWTDAAGRLWMFGGHGADSTTASTAAQGVRLNDLWSYEP